MPHYCRICGRGRRNEKFTGRGHRNHICKDCQRLPREQRDFDSDQHEPVRLEDDPYWLVDSED
jgi:hypothetical protein